MSDDLTDRALAEVEGLLSPTELERTLARLLAEARDEIARLKLIEWVKFVLTDGDAYRMSIRRGDRGCWSIEDARARMAPYHRDGDGFEVVEYRYSQRVGPVTRALLDAGDALNVGPDTTGEGT